MREEVRNSWAQALEDLKTAKLNIGIKRYYASVFFSQQAAEKALKAFYMHKLKRNPMTHNVVSLSKDLKAPKKVVDAAIELNPEYVITRYPDAANGVPAEMFDEDSAKLHYNCGEVILDWVKRFLR